MAIKYFPADFEKKWAKKWEKDKIYQVPATVEKEKKFYTLVEFPYPSGAGLHVGHARSWSAMDAYSRKKRMQGYKVLYPMGWDAFGLPAENYAIKMGIHPSITVAENIARFKKQCQSLGLSFDWSREINTTDPNYYKWTQWIFIQLFKKGLAYRSEVAVNWCPVCKTNLADEEVLADGTHERCGKQTEKKMQKQWLLKITKYAQRLLDDLDTIDYSPQIKRQQVNWIGRKEGINITYNVVGEGSSEQFLSQLGPTPNVGKHVGVHPRSEKIISDSPKIIDKITCFTTRPDTNFGATFIVIAPEHPFVEKILNPKSEILNKSKFPACRQARPNSKIQKIKEYIQKAKTKTEMEREAEGRKKTGVFTGFYAVNNLNGRLMPIWISDFVLASFGTGAVVGVPGHDIRDFEFAKEFNLDIIRVVVGKDGDRSPIRKKEQVQEEEGTMINSEFLDGINIHDATKKIMDYIEEKGWGKRVITYHLRDWIFSRQHYWGEPIPMIFCPKCAENQCQSSNVKCQNDNTMSGWFPIPEDQLPLKLPYVKSYKPTNTGESPLAHIKEFVETKCPKCEGKARRETDTMPNWAGSNWYFIRYLDNKNDKEIAGREKMNCWMPVDIYQGGFEHTTLHLLYSRFIYKFLYDIDVVPSNEPYAKRRSHGIVLGPDGRKMSKSFNNVINPDDISKDYGADTLRIYEMFIGPFDQMVAWSDKTVAGVYRFLKRVWNVYQQLSQKSKARLPSPMAQAISEQVKSQKYPPAIAYGSGNWRAGNSKLKTEENKELVAKLKKTILKVTSDFDNLKFNTAVAAMMEFVNAFEESVQVQSSKFKVQSLSTENAKRFLQILAPFAPFITEEIWHSVFGEKKSIHLSKWPDVNKEPIDEEEIIIPVQVNGKLRSTISIKYQELSIKNRVEKLAIKDEKVKKYLEGKKYQVIYIPNKILNFVTK